MDKKSWAIPFSKPQISAELTDAGYPPLLAALLSLRGFSGKGDADRFINKSPVLGNPLEMKDMDKARDRILAAIKVGEKVAVYGDYDVDGITASCLLTSYFKSKGLECECHIPDREGEGYGLNNDALDSFKENGVSLVVTVDCGITAVEEAEHAKKIGIDLIITDHHECPSGALPDAVAVVDYKRPDDEYPYKILAGVGVAFKLVCACEGSAREVMEEYADLVSIGTVADVMSLVEENRYLVNFGLEQINKNPRVGIQAMLESTSPRKLKNDKFSETEISFSLAPRLNAAGRMGRASTAARLISATDIETAKKLAQELTALNDERKKQERVIWSDAVKRLGDTEIDSPIVLSNASWHPGVIGIVASRLAEKYSVPAIIICPKDDPSAAIAKGSCRSCDGFNLHAALDSCSEHLVSFGGHALAAGLSIDRNKVDSFRDALREYYMEHRPEGRPKKVDLLITDPDMLSIENVQSLSLLEPYGTDNERPVFCMYGVTVRKVTAVGAEKSHLKLNVLLKGKEFDCIYFSKREEDLGIHDGMLIDIRFTPRINVFNNQVSVQLDLSGSHDDAVNARPHDAYALCSDILNGENYFSETSSGWTAAGYAPERKEFIKVWSVISVQGFAVGRNVGEILAQVPAGIYPETFCICLKAFYESGLLVSDGNSGVYSSYVPAIYSKVELEETDTLKSLRSIRKN